MNVNANLTNAAKINNVLDEVQARSKVRTITIDDIKRTCKRVEDMLEIAKTYMTGVTFHADLFANRFPSRYKGRPESTHFTCRKTATGWQVMEIWRDDCTQTEKASIWIMDMPDPTKNAIIKSKMSD